MDTVRDIMRTELVTVGPDMSTHDLAKLLANEQISGAPVVDVDGEVLGVVSMSPVLWWMQGYQTVHVSMSSYRHSP